MSKKRDLTREQIDYLAKAAMWIQNGFVWADTEEGHEYWSDVTNKLNNKVRYGTSDGKPYVEPERWRVPNDEDAKSRPKCRVRDIKEEEWEEATLLYVSKLGDESHRFLVINSGGYPENFCYCEILDT